MKISDPVFDRSITLREAYLAMERLVAEHVDRGDLPTVALLANLGITESGYSGDPAAFEEFLAAVDYVTKRHTRL